MGIKIHGCNLGPDLCLPDEELAFKSVNILLVNTLPNILLESEHSEIYLERTMDLREYFNIDPTRSQNENIFYVDSQMRIKDNYWDIFDLSEYVLTFFEKTF